MNNRYAAFVTLFLVAGAADPARADVLPPNACTVPGQPCTYDGGGFVGICTPSTCTRRGPIYDAALDADGGDGGIIIGDIKYPCNLCLRAPDGGDAEAGADADDDAGEGGGAGGTGGTGGTGTGGAGTGGTAGSAGTVGGADANAGAGGASGAIGTGGAAGSAGTDTGSPDSGCSCILDTDRSQTSLPLTGAFGLASAGGYFWLRRRSARTPKKGDRSR